MNRVEDIKAKYADETWPRFGYFIHDEVRRDVGDLLAEIDRLSQLPAIQAGIGS